MSGYRPQYLVLLAGAAWLTALAGLAAADDKLTEKNMTKADYDSITETESSVETEPPVEGPKAVHSFSERDDDAARAIGAKRVLSGKEWVGKTPKQRDAYLRDLRKEIPVNVRIVITVPKGEIWLISVTDYVLLGFDNVIRQWTEAEKEALPKTVARDGSISHSDIHGMGSITIGTRFSF